MNIEEHIKYWIELADDDLDSASANFDIKRYNWCLFIAHLAIEKLLKAIFVQNNNNKVPPRIHNLRRLAELSNLNLTNEQILYLEFVNNFHIEVRYPEYKNEFYKIANVDFASENLLKIKELYQCLKSLIK